MEFNNYIRDIITVDVDKCIGCNKCIKVCPIKVANTTTLKEGTKDQFITKVNPDKCINCGECVKVCRHGARGYNDHSEKFFKMFENNERINIIVAPAIKTAFPNGTWKHVLKYFQKGNVKVYDVSFGADICTWSYNNYLKYNRGSKIISQPCPAIVNYIEKYKPSFCNGKLIPVHSPASCLAIYLKKYHNHENNTPIVLFSPCIAKTSEAIKFNTFNFNVTFENLQKYLEKKGLNFENLGDTHFEFNAHPGILGQLFPRPGGLKDNILALQPDLVVRTSEGPQNVYKRIERYAKVSEDKRPDILDVLNCQHGCNQGTATISNNTLTSIESYMDELEIVVQKSRGRLLNRDKNYKQFDKNLNFEDFKCSYEIKYETTKLPTEKEIDEIFKSMLKTTHESRTIDCNSCGYDTCHEMACMIYQGYNIKDNCVYYMKNKLKIQLEKISDLHDTLENELQILSDTSVSLNNTIESVSSTSIRSNQILKGLIADLNSMSSVVENFQEYFSNVDVNEITSEDIENVINLFEKLGNIFNDSFLSRLQTNIKNDEENIETIHSLDVQSQKLSNMILEINNKFDNN